MRSVSIVEITNLIRRNSYLLAYIGWLPKKAGASGNSAEDHYFYHAENESDFDEYFNSWYDSVLSTAEDGVIEDPLGDMVN
ncbi:hypothetical protein CF160_16160 [Enterococcus pseudoavium]|nr:hypothetical protein CF160_16160 [Enterococcus pseudoavium]